MPEFLVSSSRDKTDLVFSGILRSGELDLFIILNARVSVAVGVVLTVPSSLK